MFDIITTLAPTSVTRSEPGDRLAVSMDRRAFDIVFSYGYQPVAVQARKELADQVEDMRFCSREVITFAFGCPAHLARLRSAMTALAGEAEAGRTVLACQFYAVTPRAFRQAADGLR